MQLFTIGLFKLRDDGTRVLDAAGEPLATYDNDDILAFARVWTGWTRAPYRSNLARRDAAALPVTV